MSSSYLACPSLTCGSPQSHAQNADDPGVPEAVLSPFPAVWPSSLSSTSWAAHQSASSPVMAYDRFHQYISYPLRYAKHDEWRSCVPSGHNHVAQWLSALCCPDHWHSFALLDPTDPALLLRCTTHPQTSLLNHVHRGDGDLCALGVGLRLLSPDSAILCIHRPFHPERSAHQRRWRAFQTCASPACGPLLLCSLCFHLPETRLQGGLWTGLWLFSAVMTPLLNPMVYTWEQGSEESSVEA